MPQAIAEVGAAPRRATTARLMFLDNIKLALTALVVTHHIAITYGADGSWYYYERPSTRLAQIALTIFDGVNQSYFMGLFFFISGYFTPGSYERKGTRAFFQDRLLRLGVPLLLFSLFVSPLLELIKAMSRGKSGELTYWAFLKDNFRLLPDLAPGPLWFVETLLVFSVFYAAARHLPSSFAARSLGRPGHGAICVFALVMGLLSFVVRIFFPIGVEVAHLQLGFFPQYVLLFAAGVVASRRDWLTHWPRKMARVWFPVAVGSFMSAIVVVFASGGIKSKALFVGGLHWETLAFTILESLQCVAICVCIVSVARSRFNSQSAFVKALNGDAYAVYIVHAPVIVCLAYWARGVSLDPLLKFVLVAAVAVPLCFVLSRQLRRLPFAQRIL